MNELHRQKLKDAWTPERRAKFSETIKQRYRDYPELRAGLSKNMAGVPKTDTQKERMSEASKGRAKSPEHAKAMSEAHKYRHFVIAKIQDKLNINYAEARKELKGNRAAYYEVYREEYSRAT